MKLWWDQVLTTGDKAEGMDHGSAWIDVRDIADAHVLAIETQAAGGERVIVSAGEFVWKDWGKLPASTSKLLRSDAFPSGCCPCRAGIHEEIDPRIRAHWMFGVQV